MELPNDPAIPLLGLYPKEFKAETQTDIYLYIHVHSTIIHNSQKVETNQCPGTDKSIHKMWYIHTMEYYSAFKKKEVLTHATT